MNWKISLVLLGEIFWRFLNTLTADGRYPIEDWENLPFLIQMQLSEKRKTFSHFFFHLWTLHQTLNILKKKDDRLS